MKNIKTTKFIICLFGVLLFQISYSENRTVDQLKSDFKQGIKPTGSDFANLIDACYNTVDDSTTVFSNGVLRISDKFKSKVTTLQRKLDSVEVNSIVKNSSLSDSILILKVRLSNLMKNLDVLKLSFQKDSSINYFENISRKNEIMNTNDSLNVSKIKLNITSNNLNILTKSIADSLKNHKNRINNLIDTIQRNNRLLTRELNNTNEDLFGFKNITNDKFRVVDSLHLSLKDLTLVNLDSILKISDVNNRQNFNIKNLQSTVAKHSSKLDSLTNDFSDEYKNKLESIDANATNYQLPLATSKTMGGVILGPDFVTFDGKLYSTLDSKQIQRQYATDTSLTAIWTDSMKVNDVWTRIRMIYSEVGKDTTYSNWNPPYKFRYEDMETKINKNFYFDSSVVVIGEYNKNKKIEGSGNTFIGEKSGYSITGRIDTNNTILGVQAGYYSAASENVIIGAYAGRNLETSGNVIIGSKAANENIKSSTVIGYGAGHSSHAVDAIFIGENAGFNNSSYNQVVIGKNSLGNNSGSSDGNNVVVGNNSLKNAQSIFASIVLGNNSANKIGKISNQENIIIGNNVFNSVEEGNGNIYIGFKDSIPNNTYNKFIVTGQNKLIEGDFSNRNIKFYGALTVPEINTNNIKLNKSLSSKTIKFDTLKSNDNTVLIDIFKNLKNLNSIRTKKLNSDDSIIALNSKVYKNLIVKGKIIGSDSLKGSAIYGNSLFSKGMISGNNLSINSDKVTISASGDINSNSIISVDSIYSKTKIIANGNLVTKSSIIASSSISGSSLNISGEIKGNSVNINSGKVLISSAGVINAKVLKLTDTLYAKSISLSSSLASSSLTIKGNITADIINANKIETTLNITSKSIYLRDTLSAKIIISSNSLNTESLQATSIKTTGLISTTADIEAKRTISADGNISSKSTISAVKFEGYGTTPIGGIIMWSGSTAPDGWALCDGSQFNGTKTPDLRGKFVLGQSTDYKIKDSGGKENIIIEVKNLPNLSHNHSYTNTTNHSHYFWDAFIAENFDQVDDAPKHNDFFRTERFHDDNGDKFTLGSDDSANDNDYSLSYKRQTETTSVTITGNTDDSNLGGSSETISIMPPYYVLAYIIRVK